MTVPGIHNDPTGYWSLARDHAVQPAASWSERGLWREALGTAIANAPPQAAHYTVRIAELPGFPAREVWLPRGTVLDGADGAHDRLVFVLSGQVKITTGGSDFTLEPEDAARAIRGAAFRIEALDDARFVQASVPPLNAK